MMESIRDSIAGVIIDLGLADFGQLPHDARLRLVAFVFEREQAESVMLASLVEGINSVLVHLEMEVCTKLSLLHELYHCLSIDYHGLSIEPMSFDGAAMHITVPSGAKRTVLLDDAAHESVLRWRRKDEQLARAQEAELELRQQRELREKALIEEHYCHLDEQIAAIKSKRESSGPAPA